VLIEKPILITLCLVLTVNNLLVYHTKTSYHVTNEIPNALGEMYPKRTKEQLISELVSAALEELERSFPYIESNEVASLDEFGDPIYKDQGPTSEFQNLTRKHLARYKGAANA